MTCSVAEIVTLKKENSIQKFRKYSYLKVLSILQLVLQYTTVGQTKRQVTEIIIGKNTYACLYIN